MSSVDSRCGLICTGCPWKESHGCGGCIETMGNPFHGKCPIAVCCQDKGLLHCGECSEIPCKNLYEYSYLDPEHGDKPQGHRVVICREWAASCGTQAWKNVLLTSAGFEDFDGNSYNNIKNKFYEILGKNASDAKILFISEAAITDEEKRFADICWQELVNAGINTDNIFDYKLDGGINEDKAMAYDCIYFTGGNTRHLLDMIKKYSFDKIIKKMVYSGKAYVGVSAGSLIATPNINLENAANSDIETAGLALVHAYISVHCNEEISPRADLPLPHVTLSDRQALLVNYKGYELIEG